MTIRSDLTVNWGASPRIVEVAAPSTELTIQDLYDTLRSLGVEEKAIDEPEIIDGSGKETLGPGILVGLTIKLLNAKVKFEARPPPNWIACTIQGGNLVAVDGGGNPVDPVEPSAYTQIQLIMSAAGTITITGSGVTEQDKIDIADKVEVLTGSAIKAKTDHLPTDPADESLLEAAIATRASETHVQNLEAILDTIKGLGFDSAEDALRVIRQLMQASGGSPASFNL